MKYQRGKNIRVAGIARDPNDLRTGVAYFGRPGSGKSSLVKKQVADATYVGDSGVILDVSDEMTDHIAHHGNKENTAIARIDVHKIGGVGIDFAKVLDRPSRWEQFAQKICPDIKGDTSPFFRQSARRILVAGMDMLHTKAPGVWTLADLVKLCRDRTYFSTLAKMVRGIYDPYASLGDTNSSRDVEGTVFSVAIPLGIFAALNDRTETKVSPFWPLEEDEEGKARWMLLVRDDRFTSSVESIHAFLIDMIAEEALSKLRDRRLHIIADEIRAYDALKCISEIARRGRKSACCLTITLHEINGFYDRYGKEPAEEILSLLSHKVVLRCGGVDTAEWCSKVLGVPESLVDIQSRDEKGRHTSQLNLRPNVIADQIRRSLDDASWADDRIEGFVDFPDLTAPFSCPFRADIRIKEGGVETREPVPPEWERLGQLTVRDCERLGIDETDPAIAKIIGIA